VSRRNTERHKIATQLMGGMMGCGDLSRVVGHCLACRTVELITREGDRQSYDF
jgi:hypothetical protein